MVFEPSIYPLLIIGIFVVLANSVMVLILRKLFVNKWWIRIVPSLLLCAIVIFGLRNNFRTESDFVILTYKEGHPAVFTMFRVEPEKAQQKDSCWADPYTPHNESIFTAATEGDVLKKYRYLDSYSLFGKVFWQDCYEAYMPIRLVSLYPDMNYWPFREGDIKPGDPDYKRISALTEVNRSVIKQ